jgi:hypothetical protein
MAGQISANSARKASSSAILLPLVLSIMWRMLRDWAARSIGTIWGWIDGSPPENWTTSGNPSVATR